MFVLWEKLILLISIVYEYTLHKGRLIDWRNFFMKRVNVRALFSFGIIAEVRLDLAAISVRYGVRVHDNYARRANSYYQRNYYVISYGAVLGIMTWVYSNKRNYINEYTLQIPICNET